MTTWSPDTNEGKLLLACCRVSPEEECVEAMRALILSGIHWIELIRLAIPHGLLPLVAKNLATYAADLVPSRTLAQFEAHRKRVAQRNQSQTTELLRIIDLLAQQGIPALSFKGPLLALVAYADISVRESHDLDIWIHPDHLGAAGDLLREQNYHGAGHTRGIAHLLKRDGGNKQSEFLNTDSGVLIELHDELQSAQFSFAPAFEEVWSRRKLIEIDEKQVSVFCPEDLLIALAVHGSKHMWRRISWIADIAGLVVRSSPLDWQSMLQRATLWRARRRLLFACGLAEDLLGAALPEDIRREIGKHAYTRSSVKRVQACVMEDFEIRTAANFASELRNHVENADTIADRLRIISSYSKKIVKVDETKMLRPMNHETHSLYRLSRGFRSFLGRLVH